MLNMYKFKSITNRYYKKDNSSAQMFGKEKSQIISVSKKKKKSKHVVN